jgi:hypothetical protein
MKKIALDIETLTVDSFVAGSSMDMDRGTVQANAIYTQGHSCQRTPCCPRTTLC